MKNLSQGPTRNPTHKTKHRSQTGHFLSPDPRVLDVAHSFNGFIQNREGENRKNFDIPVIFNKTKRTIDCDVKQIKSRE